MLRCNSRRKRPAWPLAVVGLVASIGVGVAAPPAPVQDPARALRILVVPTESEATWLRNQIAAGASFQALVRERSVDASAGGGGYLRVDPRALRTEFRAALEGLEPGEVSAVTRVGDQFVLLKWLTADEELWTDSQDAGEAALGDGRWTEAVEAFAVAVRTAERPGFPGSDLSRSLRGLADAYASQGLYPQAETAYQRMLSVRWGASRDTDPALIEMLDQFAEVLGRTDFRDAQFDSVLESYLQAMTALEPEARLSLAMAGELIGARLPDAAERVMLETVERQPESRELRYELAEMYAESMDFGKALEAFLDASRMQAPELDPETDRNQRAVIQERMGQIYTGLNRFGEAAAAFRAALEIDPTRLDSRLGLAKLDADEGRLDAAIEAYRAILADRPGTLRAYHGLARANLQLNRPAESIAAANQALAIDSSYQNSRYVLGRALAHAGRAPEGRRELEQYRQALADRQARENDIRVTGALNREGASLLLQGRVEESLALLRSGITTYPEASVLRFSLGIALSKAGQYEAAIRTFEAILELDDGDLRLVDRNLALLYDALGNTEASLRHRVSYWAEYDASLAEALN